MEWHKSSILRFVELYKETPVLWNTKHPDHYNRYVKQRAWEVVATGIGTSVDECKKKIISLLSSLRRERMKIKNNRAAIANGRGCSLYRSRWFAYKSFMFLMKHHSRRNPDETQTDGSKEDIHLEDHNLDDTCEDEDTANVESASSPEVSPPRKKRNNVAYNSIQTPQQLHPVTIPQVTTVHADKGSEDECHAYGKFIGEKLKSYPPLTRSCVQHAIGNVLFNADRGHYDENYVAATLNSSNCSNNRSSLQSQGKYVFLPVDGLGASSVELNPLDSEITDDVQTMKTEVR